MYTLSRITPDFVLDTKLGNQYSVISKEYNKKQFVHFYKSTFGNENTEERSDIVKFVVTDTCIPIHKQDLYNVLTENGSVLKCLNDPNQ